MKIVDAHGSSGNLSGAQIVEYMAYAADLLGMRISWRVRLRVWISRMLRGTRQ